MRYHYIWLFLLLIVDQLNSVRETLFEVCIVDFLISCTLRTRRAIRLRIFVSSAFLVLSTLNSTSWRGRSLLLCGSSQRPSIYSVAGIGYQLLQSFTTVLSNLYHLL